MAPMTSIENLIEDSAHFDFTSYSHRKFNPLTGSYVLCSPHRAKRPWQGAEEDIKKSKPIEYDPKCYLCPGNIRATGDINPKYESTYVFTNDYPAVRLNQPDYREKEDDSTLKGRLLKASGVRGKCFVICFSPNHGSTLPIMHINTVKSIVDCWQKLYADVQKEAMEGVSAYKYIQIFENKGAAMGCSNPHPHGQAWCLDIIPSEVSQELTNMASYKQKHQSHLLGDYVKLEIEELSRIILSNDSFIVVVPYWALWPFETLLISKEHLRSLKDFNEKHKLDLAEILKKLTTKYDNLFKTSFPYSMGIHQLPLKCSDEEQDVSWFHMHFYPPLLRSASVKKFCVGFEMLGEPQRDLTSEQAAARLQELEGNTHYSKKL